MFLCVVMFVLVLRDWLKGRRIEAVFPSWRDQTQVKLDKQKYPGRNVVELCIGWLKISEESPHAMRNR